jgi:transposase InsO family protein
MGSSWRRLYSANHTATDGCSRGRAVSLSWCACLRTEPVLVSPEMAIWQRRPRAAIRRRSLRPWDQYASVHLGKRCGEAGVRPALGSVGNCYKSALCESSFATEVVTQLPPPTFADRARLARRLRKEALRRTDSRNSDARTVTCYTVY